MNNLEKACTMHQALWAEDVVDGMEEYQHTKEYNRFIKKLMNRMKGDHYHKMTKSVVRLLIVAAVILSVAVTASAVPTTNEYEVYELIYESIYRVVEEEKFKEITYLNVGYLPEGFVPAEKQEDKVSYNYEYKKGECQIDIAKGQLSGDIRFDSENHKVKIVKHNNIDYVVYYNDESSGVIWNNGRNLFRIGGNIGVEELLKIAYSVS
ncbi:MAG: DUF4367 domain-containing protein [Eubacterium sp.]